MQNFVPEVIADENCLNSILATPSEDLVELMRSLDGDLILLGVAGKMGVSLAELAIAAIERSGVDRQVFGVARFSDLDAKAKLDAAGVHTIVCDLLERSAVARLPKAKNVLFMAGRKFGTAGAQYLTWAMNTLVPSHVAEHFRASRIVAFSTGCVYPLVRVNQTPDESVAPNPVGEYAQSCLGRERMFEYHSQKFGTPVCLFRLNYAIDLRYGVLHDIAQKVWLGEPVDNSVGHFNVIWQGDANHQALFCLERCLSPPAILNVTGPETLATEEVARRFGTLMNRPVRFSSESPGELAYLSDSSLARQLFGAPRVTAEQLILWQADWIMRGGRSLNKPTHFEVDDGKY